ncbi:MAG: beta-lactamase family protein [Spirochaetales bacterium]|nr:beta-lactamase family protein [Spirochaetales bacterium]
MIHTGKTDCRPEEAGYNPAVIETLDNHFTDLIGKGTIQAAGYLLARRGMIFASKSMGKLTASGNGGDFLPDSIRPIASVTKVFTVTAILQLMEKGKLFPDQAVCGFLPEFDTEMHHHITIFHLLTHTSGLRGDPGSFFEPYPDEWDGEWTKENWIKKMLTGPLHFKPGTVWSYCSKGFLFLAEIVARLSGMDFDRYVEEHIFKPLGMDDSFFFVPPHMKGRVSLTSSGWNREKLDKKRDDVVTPSFFGGGGIWSTLPDLWKFGQMMLNGGSFRGNRLLGRKTVETAVRAQVRDITAYSWRNHIYDESYRWTCGLGWEVNKHNFLPEGTYDHEGSEGVGIFIDPSEQFIFAGFYPAPDYHCESWVNPLAVAWSGIE